MNEEEAKQLLGKYLSGQCSAREEIKLRSWYQQYEQKELPELSAQEGEEQLDHIWQNVLNRTAEPAHVNRTIRLWPRIAAAASILLFLSIGGYFWLHKRPVEQVAQNDPEQLSPVQKGVILTIAKGQQMILKGKYQGQLINLNGTHVNQQDSLLSYQGKGAADDNTLNTLTNNGSSKFSVTLADGTIVTLDIGSSLTYPIAFNSSTRSVSMTGQAYFKVKHIAGQRFLVNAKGQVTEDLATEFNINAYEDEAAVKTTLVEGAVKVAVPVIGAEVKLKPGEQSVLDNTALKTEPARLEDVTAWLQGKLIFHNETLENILRRVARIYGVKFTYQDEGLRKLTYYGSINSTKKLATVLNFFRRAGGVDFMVQGQTVTVLKGKK